ncbi:MAG TPA: hypothetical protein VGP33_00005, partial [Chloroflexota bacterium]|nr:hypothetical protein [Chloroflexota bacterium]
MATQESLRPGGKEIADAIAAARLQTLRHLLALLALAYVLWQFFLPLIDTAIAGSVDALLERWVLLVMMIGTLGGAYVLSDRRPSLAGPYLLATATLTCTAALWLLQAPSVLFLYCLIVLTAATLVTPLGAWLVGGAALLTLLGLQATGLLPFLSILLIAEAGGTALLAGVLGASFYRTIAIAVEWSEQSLERANRNAEEAKRHRGRLVHAVQQLDDTHYRLR